MEKRPLSHHDKMSYYCVVCSNEDCRKMIPLLLHDSQKQRRNPPEFRIRCPFCDKSSLYSDSQIQVSLVRHKKGFVTAEGFRNARI
jgi:hypothetical protein